MQLTAKQEWMLWDLKEHGATGDNFVKYKDEESSTVESLQKKELVVSRETDNGNFAVLTDQGTKIAKQVKFSKKSNDKWGGDK